MEAVLLRLLSDIKTVGIGDIIDILVIAFIVYRMLSVVRRTSAGSVIKGIVLLVVIISISSVLQLSVLNYLIEQAVKMGIIILVILFQPELRRLLEQFGSSNFRLFSRRKAGASDTAEIIDIVVAACCEMSKTKTGALIVFERGIGLNDYAATGTVMGSHVSTELLLQIFYPNTPLHDGAVLLRGARITAAGCMLPMSQNMSLSKELGMRHKAGIGMSERSDAISVIVSEETGSISVAVDGMLKRHLTRDTFTALLRNELIADAKKRMPRRRPTSEVKK